MGSSPKLLGLYALTVVSGIAATTVVSANDWPHWRGPNRDGTVAESSGWDEGVWDDLEPAWEARVGEGSSSPLIVGDRIYVIGWADGRERLECLDAETGEAVWRRDYEAPRYGRQALGDQGLYSGTTATPEYDPQSGLLFTLGIDGDLRCWDTGNEGVMVWAKNLYDSYEIPQRPKVGRSGRRDYGFTTAPLVQGDALIVEVGAATGTLIGFEKSTGRERWRSRANHPPGHTGGVVPLRVEGVPCVAVLHFEGLLVARIDEGREGETVCEIPWLTEFANNVVTPAVWDDNVIVTSSYNQQRIARYRLKLDGQVEQVWERKEASKVCSPVIDGDHLYLAWRQVHCLDLRTGETRWQGGPMGDAGSLVLTADRRLVLWANQGDLRLLETAARSPDRYRMLAEIKTEGRADAWPHLALASGRLVCKDRSGRIRCFRLD